MAKQQWWIQIDGLAFGPMAAERLREMATEGAIDPDTLVSRDSTTWLAARKVRGLFQDPVTTPPPGAQRPSREDQGTAPGSPKTERDHSENQRGSSGADLKDLLPLIRLNRKLWKTEILALYERHALLGTRYFMEFRFTEEMCHGSGEAALTGRCHRFRRIDYEEIDRIGEQVPAPGRDARHQLHFEIQGGHRGPAFALAANHIGHVREYLAQRLGGRYQWRSGRKESWIPGTPPTEAQEDPPPPGNPMANLLIISILMLGASVPIFLLARVVGVVWASFGVIGVMLSLLGWRGEGKRARQFDADFDRANGAKSEPARQPFRSALAGWVLKIAGVLYWLMMASPLSDGIGEFIQRLHAGYWGTVLLLPLWAPAVLLVYFGYRLCQRPFSPEAVLDEESKPILFLRPFVEDARMSVQDDEGISLQPGGLLPTWAGLRRSGNAFEVWKSEWATEGGATGRFSFWNTAFACSAVRLLRMVFDRDVATAEESLARFFKRHGEPFAIGKPGERLATPGVPRVYVANKAWQATVSQAIAKSHAIVIQPGRTAGVRWELEQIRKMADPRRVLLSMVSFWKEPQAYEELARLAREATKIQLPRVVPFLRTPVFIYFQAGWQPELQAVSYKCPLLWPITGNGVDVDYSLRPFLERIDTLPAKKRDIGPGAGADGIDDLLLPRDPRWVKGMGAAVTRFAGLFLAIALMIAPVMGTDYLLRKAWDRYRDSEFEESGLSDEDFPKISLAPLTEGLAGDSRKSALIDSPWTTLKGKSLPYSLSIPASFVKREPTAAGWEYYYTSPDQRFIVNAEVRTTPESVSEMLEQIVEVEREEQNYSDVRLESTHPVKIDGLIWTEARVLLELAEAKGAFVRQTMRIFSDDRGSVLVETVESAARNPAYAGVTEKILESVRLEKAPEPLNGNDLIVGRWESLNAQFIVIQEFTREGKSEITFTGNTTRGTYTLDKDVITWNSGATTLKVKVKFTSPTEMELSNEAGVRVAYRKVSAQELALREAEPVYLLPVGADGKPLNFDFEKGTLEDWTAEGDAFRGQPIKGDTVSARLPNTNIRSQHQGEYWIGTFERRQDPPTGTLTSVPFRVTHFKASFLVGGGVGEDTCVELVRKSTGEVFWRTSGTAVETMRRVDVNLWAVRGEEIFIRLVDRNSRGWGHINFDDFRFLASTPVTAYAPSNMPAPPNDSPTMASAEPIDFASTSAAAMAPAPPNDTRPVAGTGTIDPAVTPVPDKTPAPPNDTRPVAAHGTIDLLRLIDPRRDAVVGSWKWDKTSLVTGAQPRDRLEIPFDVPSEYRLTVVASCRTHREGFHVGLVAGARQTLVVLDGWTKAASRLQLIDREPTKDEKGSFHNGPVLRNGQPNVITCEVRTNRITVDCNGARIIDWTGRFHRLSLDRLWVVRDPKRLFIGSWDTHFEISKLELTPL
jgi:hypothetical protein